MAAKRLSMRKIKEVLRLRALGQSPGAIAQSLRLGGNTVRRYAVRAEAAGVGWARPPCGRAPRRGREGRAGPTSAGRCLCESL